MLKTFLRQHAPILLLIVISLGIGWVSLPQYGISWDEPLYYNYAEHIRQAYTPQAFSPGFTFESVYGASAADHKYYGPAYLLLASPFVRIWQSLAQLTYFQAWHWVNFQFFQIGVLLLYLFLLRWMKPLPASLGSGFMALQPVFWGHAFINPKDAPFMVAILASIYAGYQLVDAADRKHLLIWSAAFALLLGATTAMRVIGPVAGLVVLVYTLLKKDWGKILWLTAAGLASLVVTYILWPFLWANPIGNFLEVFRHMSNNPTELAVLFDGQIFRANLMPIQYIPKMLFIMLTEPAWILILVGEVLLFLSMRKGNNAWREVFPFTFLFVLLISYILLASPAVYDGFRHFLFITPILFFLPAFVFDRLYTYGNKVLFAIIAVAGILPGLIGIAVSHPYEYNYYNAFVGGQHGAMRTYENDYWLTCYQPALHWFAANKPTDTLYIQRELQLAEAYQLPIKLAQQGDKPLKSGSFLLTHVRGNLDQRSVYRKEPVVQSFGTSQAELCAIKQVK